MAFESSHAGSAVSSDPRLISLSRMLARFQQNLLTPDAETEAYLRKSKPERSKFGANLEFAGKLLVKLEQESQLNYGQSMKHGPLPDFAQKRQVLLDLNGRLKELNDLADFQDGAVDMDDLEDYSSTESSDEEDKPFLIESQTPPETVNEYPTKASDTLTNSDQLSTRYATELESNLRARFKSDRDELLESSETSRDASHSITAESLLTHNRVEQENLTNSLLQMATILKTSSQAFSSVLEEEKNLLTNTTKGIEKNEQGLEAAQRRMGFLRTMTEGKGWLARMLLYAWIFGLAIIALLIVFFMPKLRF